MTQPEVPLADPSNTPIEELVENLSEQDQEEIMRLISDELNQEEQK